MKFKILPFLFGFMISISANANSNCLLIEGVVANMDLIGAPAHSYSELVSRSNAELFKSKGYTFQNEPRYSEFLPYPEFPHHLLEEGDRLVFSFVTPGSTSCKSTLLISEFTGENDEQKPVFKPIYKVEKSAIGFSLPIPGLPNNGEAKRCSKATTKRDSDLKVSLPKC